MSWELLGTQLSHLRDFASGRESPVPLLGCHDVNKFVVGSEWPSSQCERWPRQPLCFPHAPPPRSGSPSLPNRRPLLKSLQKSLHTLPLPATCASGVSAYSTVPTYPSQIPSWRTSAFGLVNRPLKLPFGYVHLDLNPFFCQGCIGHQNWRQRQAPHARLPHTVTPARRSSNPCVSPAWARAALPAHNSIHSPASPRGVRTLHYSEPPHTAQATTVVETFVRLVSSVFASARFRRSSVTQWRQWGSWGRLSSQARRADAAAAYLCLYVVWTYRDVRVR